MEQYPRQEENGMAIAGFVLAFIFPPVGLILSIIGHKKAKEHNGKYQGLAMAGIIISAGLSLLFILGIIGGAANQPAV